MTDRYHERCLAFVCEDASRGETMLATKTVARAADAMCRARGLRPHGERLALVARAGALRARDLATALAAEGVPVSRARTLAPHLERTLDRASVAALAPDRWVGLNSARGVPDTERDGLLRFGRIAIEAARELATPRPVPSAAVRLEPCERTPDGPWLGVLAAGAGFLGRDEPEVRGFLAEVRDRLVAHHPGVRAWLPGVGAAETTVAARVPAGLPGLPLCLAPFVVTGPDTLAELKTGGLPDSALPVPVLRLSIKERQTQ